jgi:glycosyltransferase involved in cell wall biosynthesis
VLALPSLKEGWGLVVGEAAGHGVPAIAYRSAGGPTESVQHDRTGLLVDSKAEFHGAVAAVLEERGLRRRLSAEALESAGNFTWSATVRGFDRILSGLPADGETSEKPASVAADRPLRI